MVTRQSQLGPAFGVADDFRIETANSGY